MHRAASLVVLALLALPAGAAAKTYRYKGGPPPEPDTVYSVSSGSLEPIVRSKGPRVPLTNLELVRLVTATSFDRALAAAPLDSGTRVVIAPAQSHPLNFLAESAVLRHLSRRGIVSTVRRGVIPDDSLLTEAGSPPNPILEYDLATARVTYLRLVGWLPGRVKIERQGLVQGSLTLREPRTSTVLWTAPADYNLVDAFPRTQLAFVEDPRYNDLKSPPPTRSVDKVVEPVVVVGVVAGLVALFFQNRP